MKQKTTETIELRAHHVWDLHKASLYGPESLLQGGDYFDPNFKKEIFKKIIENPGMKVKISNTLDVLCKNRNGNTCPKLRDDCHNDVGNDLDAYHAKFYGLKIGKTYSSSELVEELRGKSLPTAAELYAELRGK